MCSHAQWPKLCHEGVNDIHSDELFVSQTDTLEIDVGREGKVPLALESLLMSVLHAPVMQSLATLHAHADAAINTQVKRHCKAESKVLPCHENIMKLNSWRRMAIAPACQTKQRKQDQKLIMPSLESQFCGFGIALVTTLHTSIGM